MSLDTSVLRLEPLADADAVVRGTGRDVVYRGCVRRRAELSAALVAGFAEGAEVRGVYAFGREVDGEPDDYSDLDLMVCSDDPAATQTRYPDILARISPVIGTFLIISDATELAEMVMFADFSPYQKLDLSILSGLDQKQSFAPFKCLYRSDRMTPAARPPMEDLSALRTSRANRLNDLLFSVPRFTKCLFRGDFDLYRRWFGAATALELLLHEAHVGPVPETRSRLLPQEYKRMHDSLPADCRDRLALIEPPSAVLDVAESFRRAVGWIVELHAASAAAAGEPLDLSLARHLEAFLESEIARFRSLPQP